jgi:DNA-binding transcriptional LysR family regulator
VLEHARNLLFTLERLRTDVEAFTGGVRGQVTVVASPSAIAESLPDDIAAFMREPSCRQIRVVVEERFSREVVRQVREGRAALGICGASVEIEGLAHWPYRGDELALAVPLGHPLASRSRVRLADTLGFEHVSLPPGAAAHTVIGQAAARLGAQVHYRAIVSTFDASIRVVAAGLAVSIIPRGIVQRAHAEGVVCVPLDEPWARRRFVIVCRQEDAALPVAAARLLDHLRTSADAGGSN